MSAQIGLPQDSGDESKQGSLRELALECDQHTGLKLLAQDSFLDLLLKVAKVRGIVLIGEGHDYADFTNRVVIWLVSFFTTLDVQCAVSLEIPSQIQHYPDAHHAFDLYRHSLEEEGTRELALENRFSDYPNLDGGCKSDLALVGNLKQASIPSFAHDWLDAAKGSDQMLSLDYLNKRDNYAYDLLLSIKNTEAINRVLIISCGKFHITGFQDEPNWEPLGRKLLLAYPEGVSTCVVEDVRECWEKV